MWPGRQWTYIIRDWWHKYEGVWLIGLVALGAVLCKYVGLKEVIKGLGIFALGYAAGHIFWGKDWHEGQRYDIQRDSLHWGKPSKRSKS